MYKIHYNRINKNANGINFMFIPAGNQVKIVLALFIILLFSCENFTQGASDRLERSSGIEEKTQIIDNQLAVNRYFIRENIVSVNAGREGVVKIFYLYLDKGLNKKGIANCIEAMNRFNDLNLMFRIEQTYDQKKAHIKAILKEAHEIDNFYAKTRYPKSGMPGKLIRLNRSLYGGHISNLPGNMVTVFSHELGHAFGFVHPDYKDNKYSCRSLAYEEKHSVPVKPVFGTGSSRPLNDSFMLACMGRNVERPLLLIDKIGIYNVYGRYRNKGVPFLRYKGKNGYSNYYTSDYNELLEGNDHYEPEGITGRVFLENEASSGLIPMAYYYNSKTKDHFYSSELSELGMGKDNYEFIRLYYVYPKTDGKSRLPFIRFYNKKEQRHFYTSDAAEAYELQKDGFWNYDGVIGYLSAN